MKESKEVNQTKELKKKVVPKPLKELKQVKEVKQSKELKKVVIPKDSKELKEVKKTVSDKPKVNPNQIIIELSDAQKAYLLELSERKKIQQYIVKLNGGLTTNTTTEPNNQIANLVLEIALSGAWFGEYLPGFKSWEKKHKVNE